MAGVKDYVPPTYLSNLRHQLRKHGRVNIQDRDKRLLHYIRELQVARSNSWWFKFREKVRKII